MKIQSKLFLYSIFCAVVPLIVAFILTFNTVRDSLSTTIEQTLLSQANEQLERLQRDLADSKHELGTLSKLSSMQHVLGKDFTGYLQADIEAFSARTPLFTEIIAVNFDGEVIAGNIHKFIDTSVSGTWEFEAPKLGIDFDGRVVKSHRLEKYIATQSVPLYDRYNPDKIIGALIGSINWEYLQRHISSFHVFGAEQGRQRRVYLESLESESLLYATQGQGSPYETLAGLAGDSKIQNIQLDGTEYMVATIESRPLQEFRDPKWRLHILLDKQVAYASVDDLQRYFLLTGGIVSVLSLLLGFLFAGTIVRPVKSLLTGAERLADGDYSYTLANNNASDEIGQLTTSFALMRHAVQRKEQELVAKTEVAEQAARLKGEFLANMSHEVRTPINGVLGMTELMLNTPLDHTQSRYVKTISRSGKALLAVINDILDFSKIEAGRLELLQSDFDLRELVEDVTEMVAETAQKKGVELIVQMSPDSPLAFSGDSARIRQVLINLVSNAVKFTSQGEVVLDVSFEGQDPARKNITFRVTDSGIGISEEHQQRIFDSFVQVDGTTTRQFGGTGLGLAISSKLVEIMGGKIKVDSVSGVGSTFWFSIELDQLSEGIEQIWRQQDALAGKSVLIVDDNRTNIEILENQVAFWGAKPFIAYSAKQALDIIVATQGNGKKFDAAIFDMHMPETSGMELAETLHDKGLSSEMSIMLLSSASDVLDLKRCKDLGISSLLNKPCRVRELYNCLTAAIDKRDDLAISAPEVAVKIERQQIEGRLLLAEDNPVNQDMMLEMLKIIGISAELATNGQEVLSLLETEEFDLILMDCQMPVMDGFGATREIRRKELEKTRLSPDETFHIPIIALTANAMEGDRIRCLDAGMDDYLSKPVSSQQITDMLKTWLKAKPTDSAGEKNDVVVELFKHSSHDSDKVQIDQAVFDEVWGMCKQAQSGFYKRLVETYEVASSEDLKNIASAIEVADSSAVGAHAHRLKSSTASWGAVRMAELCKELEDNGKSGTLNNATELLGQIKAEHAGLVNWLRSRESKAA